MATRLLTGGYMPIATGLEPHTGWADMLVEALCGRVEAFTDDVDCPGRL
jgi:hypothetical protein